MNVALSAMTLVALASIKVLRMYMKHRDHVIATVFLIKKYLILFIVKVKGGVDRLKSPKHSDHIDHMHVTTTSILS